MAQTKPTNIFKTPAPALTAAALSGNYAKGTWNYHYVFVRQ